MTDTDEPAIERSPDRIQRKIDELRAYNDYRNGPKGRDARYKHQGWIDALQWVLGSDLGEQP